MEEAARIVRLALLLLAAIAILGAVLFWLRTFRAPPLRPWHTTAFDEPKAQAIDSMNWDGWLAHERRLFADAERRMAGALAPQDRVAANRYWAGAPMHPASLPRDWNHSFTMQPEGKAQGVAVLVHGLSDSPYSMRHIALFYRDRGFAVVAIRLPGHGTTPASLARTGPEQWRAATRLAVREGKSLAPDGPLVLVGFSTGGTLALLHALNALKEPVLGLPDAVILLSPMIRLSPPSAVQQLARLAALLPPTAKAAWLDRNPEYNPFKYNSFPIRAGVNAYRLTDLLRARLQRAEKDGALARFPRVVAFQSVVDSTVKAGAVVHDLFDLLPENGSELVLFDVNRAAYVGPLLSKQAQDALQRLLPQGARRYRIRIVTSNDDPKQSMIRTIAPGTTNETNAPLPIPYLRAFYSLGHIALPFPLDDGLYGARPDPADWQGVALGAISIRGETGMLHGGTAALSRVMSNPFFPWMMAEAFAQTTPPGGPPAAP